MGSQRHGACLAVVALALAADSTAGGTGAPGSYLSPLVPLQRLDGENTHLHVDEVRLRPDGLLLQCSYTFGVVDARDARRMRYLSQGLTHAIPGDVRRPGCVHLAWDADVVYTTHRGNIRNPAFLSGWDISDPRQPVQLPVLQEPGVSYEGVDVADGRVFVALHEQGLGIYERVADDALTRVGSLPELTDAWGVRARGTLVLVADGAGGLVTVDASDPARPRVLGRAATGGLARDIALDGHLAYVAAGSAGLVVAVRAESTVPPGTAVWFRTVREVDGTLSAPVAGGATGTHVATHPGEGIVEFTHLVITRRVSAYAFRSPCEIFSVAAPESYCYHTPHLQEELSR